MGQITFFQSALKIGPDSRWAVWPIVRCTRCTSMRQAVRSDWGDDCGPLLKLHHLTIHTHFVDQVCVGNHHFRLHMCWKFMRVVQQCVERHVYCDHQRVGNPMLINRMLEVIVANNNKNENN